MGERPAGDGQQGRAAPESEAAVAWPQRRVTLGLADGSESMHLAFHTRVLEVAGSRRNVPSLRLRLR